MALCFGVMDSPAAEEHPGHEIRRVREAKGWKQVDLIRRSGVPARTVRRVEEGKGNPERSTIARLRRTLGLPVEGAPPDPRDVIQELSAFDLGQEVLRRLLDAEDVMKRERIRLGDLPPDIVDKPGVLRGPDTDTPQARRDD